MEEISIVQIKPQRVLGTRIKASSEEIKKLHKRAYELGGSSAFPICIFHAGSKDGLDRQIKKDEVDIEIAVPVKGKAEETEEFKVYELEGIKAAKGIHRGSAGKKAETYKKFAKWRKDNGYEVKGMLREIYVKDPSEPDGFHIEIYFPIA